MDRETVQTLVENMNETLRFNNPQAPIGLRWDDHTYDNFNPKTGHYVYYQCRIYINGGPVLILESNAASPESFKNDQANFQKECARSRRAMLATFCLIGLPGLMESANWSEKKLWEKPLDTSSTCVAPSDAPVKDDSPGYFDHGTPGATFVF